MHNANAGNSAQSTQFQFNKTLHQSHVSVRMRANNRDDFTQQLGIKISLHAQTSSSAQQTLTMDLTDDSDPLFLY